MIKRQNTGRNSSVNMSFFSFSCLKKTNERRKMNCTLCLQKLNLHCFRRRKQNKMIMIAMMIITGVRAMIALDGYIGLLSDTRLHMKGKAQHIVLRPSSIGHSASAMIGFHHQQHSIYGEES